MNLVCGSKDSLSAVEEASTCHYAMTFESSAFCSEENLRVYPIIDAESKRKWDQAYTEWKVGRGGEEVGPDRPCPLNMSGDKR